MNIKDLWSKISHLGVDQTFDFITIKQIVLANRLAFVMIFVEVSALVPGILFHKTAIIYSGSSLISLYIFTLYLNYRQRFLIAKYLLAAVTTVLFYLPHLFFAFSDWRINHQLVLPIFTFSIFSILFFQPDKERKHQYIALGVNFTFLLTYDQILHFGTHQALNRDILSPQYLEIKTPQILTWIILIFCFYFLKNLNQIFEGKLKLSNQDLTQKNEAIKQHRQELEQNLSDLKSAKATIEVKEAESRSLLEALEASSLVAQLDVQGKFIFINNQSENLLKVNKEQILGKSFQEIELLFDRDSDGLLTKISIDKAWESLLSGQILRRETKKTLHNNQEVWLFEIFSPVFDHTGKVCKVLMIGQDITKKITQKNQIEAQNIQLQKQQQEILTQQENIETKNKALVRINQNFKSSIQAAQAIQKAILPYAQKLRDLLQDYFIIYRPKDTVSGDFYWLNQIEGENLLASVDCTGHGVPGAFMSMIGNTLLDKIVRVWNITDPASIIDRLHEEIETVLRQKETGNNYGMDLSIVKWKQNENGNFDFQFAGAKSSAYYVLPNETARETMKGTRKSVGGYQNNEIQFEILQFQFPPNTLIYLGSDGLEDQNNVKRKRFGSKRLKQLIVNNAHLALTSQQQVFEEALQDHMQDCEQRDDILLIGFRLV